jgi:putative FmdB family regulatory protein
MPLYPFTCSDCSTAFDALVTRTTGEAGTQCPSCGSQHVIRGFGVPARVTAPAAVPTNCRGDGPPCGATGCGRGRLAE